MNSSKEFIGIHSVEVSSYSGQTGGDKRSSFENKEFFIFNFIFDSELKPGDSSVEKYNYLEIK